MKFYTLLRFSKEYKRIYCSNSVDTTIHNSIIFKEISIKYFRGGHYTIFNNIFKTSPINITIFTNIIHFLER
jgi:hypothetical protein